MRVIKVWDAESNPALIVEDADLALVKLLRAVFCENENDGTWHWIWDPLTRTEGANPSEREPAPAANNSSVHPPATKGSGMLLPSVISSFEVRGTTEARRAWPLSGNPGEKDYVDYYACMLPDLDRFFRKDSSQQSVLQIFETCSEITEAPGILAQQLQEAFAPRQIVALSSFIPEINAEGKIGESAIKAIQFLVQTAAKLNWGRNGAPFTVELVAGSRMQGLAAQEDPAKHRLWECGLAVGNRTLEDSLKTLIARLKPIADVAARFEGIYVAMELEPGPLFVLNGTKALKRFCELLDKEPGPLKSRVGLNLDIPHWAFLTKPDPDDPDEEPLNLAWVNHNPRVRDRIVHAHISDAERGHLCDLHLERFHQEPEVRPWIELLRERANTRPRPTEGILPYSGFISLEHEACKTNEQLQYSFSKLRDWIK